MATQHSQEEVDGARAAIEITMREIETEERLVRRRFDSAVAGLNGIGAGESGKPSKNVLDAARWNLGFQEMRWSLWDSALKAARSRVASKVKANPELSP